MLLFSMALALSVGIAAADFPTTDVTVYRLWPKTGDADSFGLTNVDSGDAGGDALFGISQLLLPQLCAIEPSFLWCENRGHLSGGKQWMVYTEYTVTTKAAFGEYTPCNPCSNADFNGSSYERPPKCPAGKPDGTFVCQSYGGGGGSSGPPPPPQCQSGFEIYHRDCLNGTLLKEVHGDEGDCCAACKAEGDDCAGWSMPEGYNSTVCQLLKKPLVQWNDAQSTGHKCKAAEVEHGGGPDCWYSDPTMNATFSAYCSHDSCSCEAIETMAMGREQGAMCYSHHGHGRRRLDAAPAPGADSMAYWKCSMAVESACGQYRHDPTGCNTCASSHAAVLKSQGCTTEFIDHACSADFGSCEGALDRVCKKAVASNSPQECEQCALNHTEPLMDANCTANYLEYACGGGHEHSNPWEEYISMLGCLLNGTWYSTHDEGECARGQNPATDNCWWAIKKVGPTVNQSCVDHNVIQAVAAVRPDCYKRCDPADQTNTSSACYLHCFFDTMVGNSSAGIPKMNGADVLAPFVASFASDDPGKGGCQIVG